jgi:hypothetical protein
MTGDTPARPRAPSLRVLFVLGHVPLWVFAAGIVLPTLWLVGWLDNREAVLAAALMKVADGALDEAKHGGRDRVVARQ